MNVLTGQSERFWKKKPKRTREQIVVEKASPKKNRETEEERNEVLEQFKEWTDIPMLLLGFVWGALLVADLVWGLTPFFETLTTIVWVLFIFEFIIELALAPRKIKYIQKNWLTVIALALPALRIVRFARIGGLLRLTRTVRSMRLIRVISSLNRSINGIRTNLARYGAGSVALMSTTVTFVGAAGMYAFEGGLTEGQGLESYGEALWWTAMIMTTLGSQYWPRTLEGRILGFILSLYAFGVFGYVTGALASFFVGREKAIRQTTDAEFLADAHREIKRLRDELQDMTHELSKAEPPPTTDDRQDSGANGRRKDGPAD